jgi:23S rRNA (guanosine2251-2'-O)-methyltransferase
VSSAGGLGGEQVEGRRAVRELLVARRRAVRRLYVAEPGGPADLGELAVSAGVSVETVSPERLRALARTDAPQGVVARAAPVRSLSVEELAAAGAAGAAPLVVVLDGVTDPRNLGAVMRSALGAGASGLVVGKHRSARLTPAAVKAAAGAAEHLPLALAPGIPSALATLAEAGLWTIGLDASAPTALWELPVADQPVAMVLGSEGRGLSPLVQRRCQMVVSIPQVGPIPSLNVSAAAAVACFEVARRRRAAD